jgi:hypothetical protein
MGFCILKTEVNDSKNSICKDFSLRDLFWCEKYNYWLDLIVCSARRAKGFEECGSCKQGLMVSYAIKSSTRKSQGQDEEPSARGRRMQTL